MIRAIRTRARVGPRDAGLGLVELLAASFISLLTLVVVGSLFIQVTRLAANGQSTKTATGIASTVLNEVSSVVRQATVVPTAVGLSEGGVVLGSTSTTLIVDTLDRATIAPGQASIVPTRVTFTVDITGNVLEQRVPGVLTGGYYSFAGTGTSRIVNGPILTTGTGTSALFVYYSGTGSTLTQVTPLAGSTALNLAQATSVTTVGLNVAAANKVSGVADQVLLTNLLTMPNVAITNGGN